ncbi:hypothetical protein SAMN05216588_101313 [Pseudomonas flavescens]|uniref:Uncharacterized protein n=1 Tax=Phytopseudomonas flavescens TaxID=29435 RepID=A0A1G7XXC4_9GAMM|nr:hypothetical protein [Pseudomonas flavescens]SDG88696.1 hypothetical protein SAMN05216588_101313 [Pseudomonas flavescens]
MKSLIGFTLMLAVLTATDASADERAPQTIRVISKAYVSPGASGSVDTYERQERYNLYGGQRIPQGIDSNRYESGQRSSTIETRGGIRQRIEYPNGQEVQRYPGQDSQQYQQRR